MYESANEALCMKAQMKRCPWPKNPLAIRYHDREWGVPVRRDRKLFEFLILEIICRDASVAGKCVNE